MGNFFKRITDEFERWGDDIESGLEKTWSAVWKGYQDAWDTVTFGLHSKLDDYAKKYLRDPLTGRGMQKAMLAQQQAQMELQAQQMALQRQQARRAEERLAAANRRAPDIGMQLANAMELSQAGGNRGSMLMGTKPPMDLGMGSGATILGN